MVWQVVRLTAPTYRRNPPPPLTRDATEQLILACCHDKPGLNIERLTGLASARRDRRGYTNKQMLAGAVRRLVARGQVIAIEEERYGKLAVRYYLASDMTTKGDQMRARIGGA